jgi:hypothetical protein
VVYQNADAHNPDPEYKKMLHNPKFLQTLTSHNIFVLELLQQQQKKDGIFGLN